MFFWFKQKTAYEMRISDWSSDVCSSDLRITRKIAEDNTFKTIAAEWLAKNEREERAAVTLRKIRWLLDIANPLIGSRPISKITPQEVLAVLRKVEANGRYESARRMRSVIRSEEHTSEVQSLMRISLAGFCLKQKKKQHHKCTTHTY